MLYRPNFKPTQQLIDNAPKEFGLAPYSNGVFIKKTHRRYLICKDTISFERKVAEPPYVTCYVSWKPNDECTISIGKNSYIDKSQKDRATLDGDSDDATLFKELADAINPVILYLNVNWKSYYDKEEREKPVEPYLVLKPKFGNISYLDLPEHIKADNNYTSLSYTVDDYKVTVEENGIFIVRKDVRCSFKWETSRSIEWCRISMANNGHNGIGVPFISITDGMMLCNIPDAFQAIAQWTIKHVNPVVAHLNKNWLESFTSYMPKLYENEQKLIDSFFA